MGQCGCADFGGEFTLPAPDGGMYVFWRYAPCDECRTPAGVVIAHVKKEDVDADMWGVRSDIPRLRIDTERLIPVVSAEGLANAALSAKGADVFDDNGYETVGDYLADCGYELLTDAMSHPGKEWKGWTP